MHLFLLTEQNECFQNSEHALIVYRKKTLSAIDHFNSSNDFINFIHL